MRDAPGYLPELRIHSTARYGTCQSIYSWCTNGSYERPKTVRGVGDCSLGKSKMSTNNGQPRLNPPLMTIYVPNIGESRGEWGATKQCPISTSAHDPSSVYRVRVPDSFFDWSTDFKVARAKANENKYNNKPSLPPRTRIDIRKPLAQALNIWASRIPSQTTI